uniref:DUF5857 domain-containing protein n=1 Tax=Pithovirus LCPAC202 TaxID=2506592 RepID=A0A481Z7D6_9VIRU|nr:MAG: hypothetical protein LCPAC202_02960 [Pithovirus LCPAC202]
MGNNCHKDFPPPDTSNVCTSDNIGEGDTVRYEIPHFCTLKGPGGTRKRREYCDRIGGGGEWGLEGNRGEGGHCTYDDCGAVKAYKTGCCDGCCGIVGRKVFCRRKAYLGNPAFCCFRDKEWRGRKGDPDDLLCFETDAREGTCLPDNRNITNSSCQDSVFEYCTGGDLDKNDKSWLERWAPFKGPVIDGNPNCVYAVNRNLFIDPNIANVLNAIQPNPKVFRDAAGFVWSRELLVKVFEKYAEQGFVIGTLPGFPGYNTFQDDVLQPICTSVPGICQQGLFATCSNSTTDELVRNPEQVPWCGCYMPQDQYQRYVDEFQVNRECTPICARQGSIPLVSANGIQPLLCNQSVCIIDDVTIALEKTNVGGNITFAQFCGGCSAPISGVNGVAGGLSPLSDPSESLGRSSSACLCIISNDTIAAASSQIEGINLTDVCGSARCFKNNPNPGDGQPNRLEIPCDSADNFNPFTNRKTNQDKETAEKNFMRWVIIAIVVIVVFIIILFMLYLGGIGRDTGKKIITRHDITRHAIQPKPMIDIKAAMANERHLLYGDRVGGSILDRGRFPMFPKAAVPGDMQGSILNRNQLTSTIIGSTSAPGGCFTPRSISTRDMGNICPMDGLSPGISNGSILDRGLSTLN